METISSRRISESSERRNAVDFHLTRLELAAAISCGETLTAELRKPAECFPVSLPGTGLAVNAVDGRVLVEVRAGRVEMIRGAIFDLPQSARTRVDAYDTLLKLPAANIFSDFPGLGIDRISTQLGNEVALGLKIVPAFIERFDHELVPVAAGPTEDRAGTHEDVPGATYISFDRRNGELLAGLVHEEVHHLLNAAESVGLIEMPSCEHMLTVPWRSDPRPLPAVLHGIAAFMRMGEFYLLMADTCGHELAREVGAVEGAKRVKWAQSVSERVLAEESSCLARGVPPYLEWVIATGKRLL
jgi:hypothetical protein